MASAGPSRDETSSGTSASELRRSVGEATERIHEIIDAAERVAVEIRTDAEATAESYLAESRREADRLLSERTAALDELTKTLADRAERFKHQAEQMLADLDRVISEARAGVYRSGAVAAVEAEGDEEPQATAAPLRPLEAAPEPEPATDPEPARRHAFVAAYPGTAADRRVAGRPDDGGDAAAEALLRATQMAVTGKDRAEIAKALRADYPDVDVDAIVDEILG